MIAAVFIVGKSFSLPHTIPNNLFAAGRSANGNAGAIITGTKLLPTHFTGRSAGRVRRSGVRITPDTGSDIASSTLSRSNVIAGGSNVVTKRAAC